MSFKTVSVIGLGYIGLPTAAMFASRKIEVVGVDVNEETVSTINQGEIHIVEPELDILVQAAVTEGYLRATTTPKPADAFLIAVPTPFKEGVDGEVPVPDLSYIEAATKAIAPVLKKGDLVILESTSPVGTTEKMSEWLADVCPNLSFPQSAGEDSDIRIAYCPERVLPGHVVRELVENDRVIGGMTERCSLAAIELYGAFLEGECITTNARTAEMAKLTENSFRDVNIAFANELSLICDELDINVWELISLANRHPRVNILQPGAGVGGHCIAVDPWFIVSKSPSTAKLIHSARTVNDFKPEWVLEKIKIAIAETLESRPELTTSKLTIACYGITFKPDIDDLRCSPAYSIAQDLANLHSGKTLVVEPNLSSLPENISAELVDLELAVERADLHVLLVGHKQFKSMCPPIGQVIDVQGGWSNAG